LFSVLDGPHQIPADVAQEIRDWEQQHYGFGWIRWLWFAVPLQHHHRYENYPQVAVTALRELRDWCRPDGQQKVSSVTVEQAPALAAATPPAVEAIAPALCAGVPGSKPHPDGLEGGRWLWWQNKRHDVPQGTVYRLLAYMWNRDSASYDALEEANVLESAVAPQTIRSYANKANNVLPSGIPWRLSTDSESRQLTKTVKRKSLKNP
jgi:hypothetical protein